jgi:small subunit ribosomal protein S3
MPVEDRFIKMGLKRMELETFLQEELGRAGYGGVDIRRIPVGTRVAIHVERPGMVIGKKGKSINILTEELEKRFGLSNPQVEVIEIKTPEFYAPIMAKRIAFALERGIRVRRVGYMMLRRIMEAGARGVEIVIGGKIAGERKKRIRFYKGYLSKTGKPAERFISEGQAFAKLKPGVIGVKVKIMPPDVPLPDNIEIPERPEAEGVKKPEVETEEEIGEAQAGPQETAPTEAGETGGESHGDTEG